MPRDTTQLLDAPPDLATPSLAGLAWLLRHEEAWPPRFLWDFARCRTCAIGLAGKMWMRKGTVGHASFVYSTPLRLVLQAAFISGAYAPVPDSRVTPEMVAARIDEYLAGRTL